MKVSIIVPVYNAAQFIPRCLQSILFQEHEDWECIVVDDGSTDDSWSRIQKICANDPPRTRYTTAAAPIPPKQPRVPPIYADRKPLAI